MVRDNQGSVVDDHVRLNVVKVEKGFNVEQPIISNASKLHINWHTANTQHAPVACTAVDILLSTDGGLNFSQVLARKTDNDGQHTVNSSGIDTQQGRVKIACSDNVFYAINPTNLVINAPKSENATIIVPATTQPATAPPKISSPSSEVEQPTEQITVAVNTDITQSDQVTSANPQTVSSQATDSQTRGQTMDANSQGGSVYGLLILLVTVCVTRYALNLDKLKSLACSIYSNTTSKAQ